MTIAAAIRASEHESDVRSGPRLLVVDADGTLYSTDLLHEGLVDCLLRKPALLFLLPLWLLKGRPYFKSRVAAVARIDIGTLPYRADVVEFLNQRQTAGQIVLATAADERHAAALAEKLGCFSAVLASSASVNLKGTAKAAAIAEYCRNAGHDTFEYVGDSVADIAVWERASGIYVVDPSRSLYRRLQKLGKPLTTLTGPRRRVASMFRALRTHQWAKNLLVYAPVVASHQLLNVEKFLGATLAFVAFSLCASAIYVLNDVCDLAADRRHAHKSRRPFASGALPLTYAPPMIVGLLMMALLVAFRLPGQFAALLGLYAGANLLYSFWLKRRLMADVIALSLMYAVRIVAGGEASQVVISEWLFAFSIFLFTSLALAKRYAELVGQAAGSSSGAVKGRAYRASDLRIIESIGPSSGLLAVLVLVLYINSPAVQTMYSEPRALWLLCPIAYYWIGRLWMVAGRQQLHHDPLVFALTDRRSLAAAGAGLVVMSLAVVL